MNEDTALHYNISDILLRTCDLNKIADFVERAENIENAFHGSIGIGSNESHYVSSLNEGIQKDEEKLLELKSRGWDEIFRLRHRDPMDQQWTVNCFEQFADSSTFIEIKEQQGIIDELKNKREAYKNMCMRVSDLLADYTYFLGRDHRDSPPKDHTIHIPGVIKLGCATAIYSDSTRSSVIPIMGTLKKLKVHLLDTLHNINCEIKHAKSTSFDIVYQSYTEYPRK